MLGFNTAQGVSAKTSLSSSNEKKRKKEGSFN